METTDKLYRRSLLFRKSDGTETPFDINIGTPFAVEDGEFCCIIHSSNVIFEGTKRIYGVDAIDCLDQAIHMIDLLSMDFSGGTLLWPDGGLYRRVATNLKMVWG